MKEDKRRNPYNIWVVVLGIVIFLIMGGIGCFIVNSALKADVNVDGIYTDFPQGIVRIKDGQPIGYVMQLEEGQSVVSKDNWQLTVSKLILYTLGLTIVVFGVFAASIYIDEYYWKEKEVLGNKKR